LTTFDAILARSFRAANGETAVRPADALAYLDACVSVGVEIDGWEAWLVDHSIDETGQFLARKGAWSGLVPVRGAATPTVVGGEGDAEECRAQVEGLDFDGMFEPQWRPYIRINFTIEV
jgi:hypothetical protein